MTTTVSRREGLGMVTLRADLADPRLAAALAATTGLAPPGPRRIVGDATSAVAWMSPDELLLLGPAAATADRLSRLAGGLGAAHHLAVDVSDARAVFRIAGPGARETLAKGVPVDLAPEAFGPGDFRRTRIGQVAAAIWSTEPEVFELACFRSVAEFVAEWLAAATAPVGFFAVQAGRGGY